MAKVYKIGWNRNFSKVDVNINALESGEAIDVTIHKNWKTKKGDIVEIYDVTVKREKPIFLGRYPVISDIVFTTNTLDKTWTKKGFEQVAKEVRPKVKIQKIKGE